MPHDDLNETLNRRGFLGTIATGAAAMGMATLATPFQVAAESNYSATGPKDADAWFNNVKGKHRIVFDATNQNDTFPLLWARIFLMTNNATGTPNNDLGVVVVLRHEAIPLAMDDRLWT